jgi:hypothetical protein
VAHLPQKFTCRCQGAAADLIKLVRHSAKATASIRGLVAVLVCCLTLAASAPAAVADDSAQGSNRGQSAFAYPALDDLPELDAQRATATPPNSSANPSTMRYLRLAGVVCASAGLVSLGAGVYYWTRATSLSDSANRATVYNQADYDDGKHAETMQWIFYGVGAAAVATGAGLYANGKWFLAPKKASVSLAPMVMPGRAGLAAVGTF